MSLQDTLKAGTNFLDNQQSVVFTAYVRTILPLDGYVFYVKTSNTITVRGSLHQITEAVQDSSESFSQKTILFTALEAVQKLNEVNPLFIWIAEVDNVMFSFSERSSYYRQAGLHHYRGKSILPSLMSQILATMPDESSLIATNSLPMLLDFSNNYGKVLMYPAFVSPENLPPPYISIDIYNTESKSGGLIIGKNSTRSQYCFDSIKLTSYGLTSKDIFDFIYQFTEYCLDNRNGIGLCNAPIPVDKPTGQVELNAISQKKEIELLVNYHQARLDSVARQVIEKALVNYI